MCIYAGRGGGWFMCFWIDFPEINKNGSESKNNNKRNYGTVHICAWLWEFYWGFSMKATVFNKRN